MKKHILILLVALCLPAMTLAANDDNLPEIPDTGKNFDPASVQSVPSSGAKTRGLGSSKRLPPAPQTKSEIIRLMKQPAAVKTRSLGESKTRGNPKGRAYINFDSGSAEIRSDSYALLYEWASALQDEELANATIKVLGHTDSVGSEDANMHLGERRATAVKERLVKDGVIPSRFLIISYGESQPYVSNNTKAGRATNRRVEFVLDYDNYVPPQNQQIQNQQSNPVNSYGENEQSTNNNGNHSSPQGQYNSVDSYSVTNEGANYDSYSSSQGPQHNISSSYDSTEDEPYYEEE